MHGIAEMMQITPGSSRMAVYRYAAAQEAKVDEILPRLHRNLTLYQASKPCRNPWPSKVHE